MARPESEKYYIVFKKTYITEGDCDGRHSVSIFKYFIPGLAYLAMSVTKNLTSNSI